ncbi:MAG: hypothetical protein B7Y93_04080 [Micrococcales bacterium 32-70-13]|nr:MAG: hypothetical protein B7Y93_04080 [Micrococcales bacterium 32-70-13]
MTAVHSGHAAAAIALTLLLAGCAPSTAAAERALTAPAAGLKEALTIERRAAESDAALEQLIAADLPGCSAAVAVRGELVWAEARGLADLTSATPLTTGTRFDIASISKQFTATAVLLLQRDGLLSLDDPVSRHLAGLPRWADEVTLGALMHHTARLPDYWIELDREGIGFTDAADQGTTLAAIAREPDREPGEGYFYSNSHYVLLAPRGAAGGVERLRPHGHHHDPHRTGALGRRVPRRRDRRRRPRGGRGLRRRRLAVRRGHLPQRGRHAHALRALGRLPLELPGVERSRDGHGGRVQRPRRRPRRARHGAVGHLGTRTRGRARGLGARPKRAPAPRRASRR